MKIRDKAFLGSTISRFKMGMQYMNLFINVVNTAILSRLAFPDIDIKYVIFLISPSTILITVFIGYFLDKTDINSIDHIKLTERAHRYLSLADIKNQTFHLMLTKNIIRSNMIKSDIKIEYLKPEFQISDLDRDYQEYLKKWKKL